MGGDIEVSRADRGASPEELELLRSFGALSSVVDTNVRARSADRDAFVDLVAIGESYPLLGQVVSPQLPAGESAHGYLSLREGLFGVLVDPLMLDQLGAGVGDVVDIGGTQFEVRGALGGLPDAAVRGFRLGLLAVVTTDGLAALSDRTSPLPGLGTWFKYKILLDGLDAEAGKAAVEAALDDASFTVRSARDGLGPMVRYYDLFMRFLVIVGLASLLIGGVSVWTGISAYVAERGNVIAVLRSMGAGSARIFLHFFTQVAMLAAIGVGIGLIVGGGAALLALPIVGAAVGVALPSTLHANRCWWQRASG
jgi:putative ABC transport system permease protein